MEIWGITHLDMDDFASWGYHLPDDFIRLNGKPMASDEFPQARFEFVGRLTHQVHPKAALMLRFRHTGRSSASVPKIESGRSTSCRRILPRESYKKLQLSSGVYGISSATENRQDASCYTLWNLGVVSPLVRFNL
jgi:hypothetical protein